MRVEEAKDMCQDGSKWKAVVRSVPLLDVFPYRAL